MVGTAGRLFRRRWVAGGRPAVIIVVVGFCLGFWDEEWVVAVSVRIVSDLDRMPRGCSHLLIIFFDLCTSLHSTLSVMFERDCQ